MKLKQTSCGSSAVKLESVITEATTGFACGQRADDGVIQVRMNNVTRRGELDWSNVLRVPSGMTDLESFALRAGDVLFNNTNSTEMVGKTACFDTFKEPVVFSNHFTRLRTDTTKLDPSFLALWLHKTFLDGLFAKICDRWIGQSAVQRSKLLGLEISLPPVAEQRRIAMRAREQIAEVERARAAVQSQLETAQVLPAALLRAVFESGKWQRLRVDELADTCSGTTPSRGRQDFYGGKIPWVKTGELVDGIIHDTEEHITETALRETSLRLLPKNTLLIAMYGQGQTRGRTALLACEATTNQACYAILPNEKFDPKFLQLWFQFSYARLRQASEGRGGNQSNFNGKVLGAEQVPLPPVSEQRAIVARLDTELTAARELVETLETRLAEIELLPATLLREAFNT